MQTTVEHCPRCGAPIYVPLVWHGVTPPPSQYTCSCASSTYVATQSEVEQKFYQVALRERDHERAVVNRVKKELTDLLREHAAGRLSSTTFVVQVENLVQSLP